MSPMAVGLAYVCTLLSVLAVPSRGEKCFSFLRDRYSDCWSGCCGALDDRDCCSSSGIVIGVAVGGAVILLVFIVVGVCLVCKCHPKFRDASASRHGRDRHRRLDRRRDMEGGAWATRSPRMVHPVGPPDYHTATQQRALPLVPAVIPLSPPPPYTETIPPPPTEPPPARHNRARQRVQPDPSQVTLTPIEEDNTENRTQTAATIVHVGTSTADRNVPRQTSQTHKPSNESSNSEEGSSSQQASGHGGQSVAAVQRPPSDSPSSAVTGRTVVTTSLAGSSTSSPRHRREGFSNEPLTSRSAGEPNAVVVDDLSMI